MGFAKDAKCLKILKLALNKLAILYYIELRLHILCLNFITYIFKNWWKFEKHLGTYKEIYICLCFGKGKSNQQNTFNISMNMVPRIYNNMKDRYLIFQFSKTI